MDDRVRELFEGIKSDPQGSARLTLGCVLTLSVAELLRGGMPVSDVHDIVELAARYGIPNEKEVSTVWVYLLAYAAQGLLAVGAGLPDVHQAVEFGAQAAQVAQAAPAQERPA